MTEERFLEKLNEERIKDILLMAIAIQFSIIGAIASNPSLVVLIIIGALMTGIVVLKEAGRRVAEFRISLRT
jgi:hypothetical protein